jgi:hypothetical protein
MKVPEKVRIIARAWVLAALFSSSLHAQDHPDQLVKIEPVDMKRVNEISLMLPDDPRGFGDPINLRLRWDSLYATGKFDRLIGEADSISAVPFPILTDSIYMSYFGGKDSETSKRFIMKRRMLLTRMIWAECLTNKGKYMPAIINALNAILNTKTWTFPAEDRKKTNYDGKIFTIGLSSSAYGSDMAHALYLLKSKLPAGMHQQIYDALQQRIFEPTLNAIKNKNANEEFISLMDSGNHNSVTLAYVAMAALAVIPDKQQRAVFATIAERYSRNFLQGYLDDGYCTEGIAYFSYGFGHFVFLRDALWQATRGKLDLFKHTKVQKMGRFAPAMEIINGVYPAISDCEQDSKPVPQLMYYLNRSLDLGLKEYNDLPFYIEQPALCYLMYYFPNAATVSARTSFTEKAPAVRNYFEKAGVLTVRPLPGSAPGIGATFKGGNNAEHHNHNDLGSYTIVFGKEMLTGDVGLATYTPKYFGKERYTLFKTTSSYGHNVPLISGTQQRAGKEAKADIVEASFSDKKDNFVMDIKSAYPLPGLKKLTRSFTYDRTSTGYITVGDTYSFEGEGNFETALITRHKWKKVGDSVIEINGATERLKVTITTSGESFSVTDEVIDEGPKPYTRIAIRLKGPVRNGFVNLRFEKL